MENKSLSGLNRIGAAELFLVLVIVFLLTGCVQPAFSKNSTDETESFSIVNWNVQTFFDAQKDGCEYQEFLKTADWNKDKYVLRLQRLCNTISQLDADIYVLEELENEGIIYDISNQLSENGHNWNQKKFWNYSFFAKPANSAIGIGILSRYPLTDAKTHDMNIQILSQKQPSTRYLLEVTASVNNQHIKILANHWKSKSGGEEKSEIWRDWQESILGQRLKELYLNENSDSVLICGDFNRDASDFICNTRNTNSFIEYEKNTILRYADFGFSDYISINNPWFSDNGYYKTEIGSYFFNDSWERIDNIFTFGNLRISEFGPVISGPWASVKGYPISYWISSGDGYSDHLPIFAKVIIPRN